MSAFERRNFLRNVMRTTKTVSDSTLKTIRSFEKGVKHSVDHDISSVERVCRRIALGLENIDQE